MILFFSSGGMKFSMIRYLNEGQARREEWQVGWSREERGNRTGHGKWSKRSGEKRSGEEPGRGEQMGGEKMSGEERKRERADRDQGSSRGRRERAEEDCHSERSRRNIISSACCLQGITPRSSP